MSIAPGTRLGPYEIASKIGGGGMGEVYLATDCRLGRKVAIKVLPDALAAQPSRLRRFELEARSASALNHPNIVTIHDIGQEGATHYIAMEFVEGTTLRRVMDAGPLLAGQAIAYAEQIVSGLAKAHDAGIAHRDLKPDNLMITHDGLVKVLDFGLVKLSAATSDSAVHIVDTKSETEYTAYGTTLGTVGYMSPEQAKGARSDPRSDQFALGAILYEMFAGRRAFSEETSMETLAAIIRDAATPLASVNPDVPPLLVPIVDRCLAKRPDERYMSMRQLGRDLAAVRDSLTSVQTPAWAGDRSPSSSAPTQAASTLVPSIAVLPFTDMSPEHDQDYFCEGMAEELISDLASLEGVRVASRTAAFRFKGETLDVGEIGRRLRVGAILEGSVRKAGNRLRITVRMTSVSDSYPLWSERYDRTMEDVFAVQDEIARAVVDKLKVKLVGGRDSDEGQPLGHRYTGNVDAYQAYLRGRHCWNKRTREGFHEAIGYFQQAVDDDPLYPLPYSGLADTYNVFGYYNTMPPREAYPKAKAAAAKALEVDDRLAEAHASLGFARLFYDRDWADAEKELQRAIELNPSYASAHQWYGWLLFVQERFEEALVCIRRAQVLDPLSPVINDHLGYSLTLTGRHDEAVAQLHDTLKLNPTYPLAHWRLGTVYVAQGKLEDAVDSYRAADELTQGRIALGYLGHALGAMGRRREAREVLERLQSLADERYISPLDRALVHAGLGEIDRTFECLDAAFADRVSDLSRLKLLPWPDEIRVDPRFADLLRRLNLAP